MKSYGPFRLRLVLRNRRNAPGAARRLPGAGSELQPPCHGRTHDLRRADEGGSSTFPAASSIPTPVSHVEQHDTPVQWNEEVTGEIPLGVPGVNYILALTTTTSRHRPPNDVGECAACSAACDRCWGPPG
jgi:hypothetical protein